MRIKIKNWDKYNPKRDQKTYTWLRLQNDIYSGKDFFEYDAQEMSVLVSTLCEASKENSGEFDITMKYLKSISRCDEATIRRAMKKLEGDDFLVISYDSETTPSYAKTTPTNDTNDTNERTNVNAKATHWLVELWNTESKGNIKKVLALNDKRKKFISMRLKEYPDVKDWAVMVKKINESSFCQGGGSTKWVANFDWLIRDKINCDKVLEGNFDERKAIVQVTSDALTRHEENLKYQRSLLEEN